MNKFFFRTFKHVGEFLLSPVKRCLLLIGIICAIAIVDFFYLGIARRTFVFYTINEGIIVVEDRMLKHSYMMGAKVRESDIIRYVDETLLGPAAPDLLPLFPRETRLRSLLYRNGVVYADFSADAALPPVEGGRTYDNFLTLYYGILRNFSFVKNIRFLIEGRPVYVEEFRQIETESHSGGMLSRLSRGF